MLDTTLRDGAQTTGLSFTLEEKLKIAEKLDELGVDYIEGGWPASNPKDYEFFRKIKDLALTHSEIAAFGSTAKIGTPVKHDISLNSILDADVSVAVLFGKSWTLHVKRVLKCSLEENLETIYNSIDYLKKHGLKVIFDAEHFFDGYLDDPSYAIEVLKTAEQAGAEVIVLADTNGGNLPSTIARIVSNVKTVIKKKIGIHTHNDSGLAVANSLVSVEVGVRHIQGTINGLGERCGNADLVQILPPLIFKMGYNVLRTNLPREEKLKKLREISTYVSEASSIPLSPYHPYVGEYAFSHKGGVHIDAVLKEKKAYEHIDPALVGNYTRLVVSDQAGRSAIIQEASYIGLKLSKDHPAVEKALQEIKEREAKGYRFDNATGSIRLTILKALGYNIDRLKVISWRTFVEKGPTDRVEAVITLQVDGDIVHGIGHGVGPVHALDLALRDAVLRRIPYLESVRLINYKVSVVDAGEGTGAAVRVFIEFTDGKSRWACTAYSRNILEASLTALIEGYTYKILIHEIQTI
ncbi:MAG: citramalate synthase [Aigarchaeota archaeon]|nr:citramalate synthase [Candidatus Geocrenenecus dongiae]